MTKYTLLLVEDDEAMAFATKYFLEKQGYDVTHCASGHVAMKEFMKNNFDLCLLDVMLSGKMDGLELAKSIREKNNRIPILMLSSKRNDEERIAGMENGADCYIPKPYSFEELNKRIQVFLKYAPKKETTEQTVFRIGSYEFDVAESTLGDDKYQHLLTQRETELLHYMCMNAGRVLKREDILMDLWGKNDTFLGRSLDVFITKLRKYFRTQPDVEIQTLYGVGFKFNIGSNNKQNKSQKETMLCI